MVNFLEQKRLNSPRRCWGWLIFACVLLLSGGRVLADQSFTASLDRNEISLGETAVLTLTFENCAPTDNPEIPQVANLQIGTGQFSQQVMIKNGDQTATATYEFELRPSKEGTYTIGPIRVPLSTGQKGVSQPLTLKVSKSPLPTPAGTPEPAFVKLIVPRQQIFLGETIPVEIRCYCQDAGNITRPRLDAGGFSTGTVSDYDKPHHQVRYGSQVYNQLIFHASISPAKTGTLALGPASWTLNLLSGPRNIWGQFTQSRQVTVNSDPVEIQVSPMPSVGMPPDFSGAIGTFALASFEAGPTNVAVGDPITLKIRISGAGNFNLVALPQNLPQWGDFKLYPPTSKFEPTDPLETQGSKYFEQVVLPQNTAIKELPSFTFSYFDPVKKAYQTLRSPPIPLTVRPTVATPQPTVFSGATQSNDTPPPTREIVHIKPALGKVGHAETPFLLRPGFWAMESLAPLVWIGAVIWRRRRENLANNPRLVRQREVARHVRSGLKELRKLAQTNKKDEFYAAVFRLLQEVLGERLDLPASGITEVALDNPHVAAADPTVLSSARELFQICNQYRYAPERGGEELASLVDKIETTLAGLQHIKPKAGTTGVATLAGMLAACLMAGTLHAQVPVAANDLQNQFTAANRLYEQGKFAEAAALYDHIIDSGWNSPVLYFNSGNAWFKAGNSGRAILAYRKAERLAPRDPDIRANLQFARSEMGTRPPSSRWAQWINRLTLNEWTVLAGTATALFFGMLAIRQFTPGKNGSRAALAALVIVSSGLIACLVAAAQTQIDDPVAVVISADTVIRRGPFTESPGVATVRDGTELLILDSNADWFEVTDAAKHTGWVQKKDIARIGL